ncbi:anti-virulence regulator CigR family protein [Pectobacterium brasiliense]|uniref:anti-virulence regulator CigR family protein n=1 Tax=Pectobacterium brasiliense TaxID=180957 RepID=UPI002A80DB62|nr:anti-virulence regulator CigR family protein [Pectobacterium brasiliense]MDY4367622.1 anti-virulence regulator CigR family protein [Pectobacterium brasiliense]MDY7057153.1 anti-virulence regulator CigR family protein [Pectobacterium brasiliense]
MLKHRTLKTALAAVISFTILAAPVYANPGNGNGHGNSGVHGNKGHGGGKWNEDHGNRKNYGKPSHVDSDISFSQARALAVNYGLLGYQALPPSIAKNVARGKPLPPGIAKKTLPASMINNLPYYPGYEWRAVGKDLVLVALSTAIVTAVINGVFD